MTEGVDGEVIVEIAVLRGSLGQDVGVRVYSLDDSALGKTIRGMCLALE